jgi:hypothetical protein
LAGNQALALTTQGTGPIFTVLDSAGHILSQDAINGAPSIPPIILSFPSFSQTLTVGSSATLSVTALGSVFQYQWQRNGANIPGATQSTLTLSNLQVSDTGDYGVVVSNAYGSTTSLLTANLTVTAGASPQISVGPTNQTAVEGSGAVFSVTATGTNLAYQWYHGGTAIAGATGPTLTIAYVSPSDNGSYQVSVTSGIMGLYSPTATLTVVLLPEGSALPPPPATAPVIVAQPANQAVVVGGTATFSVGATGNPAPTYQWTFNGTTIAGATGSSYTVTNAQSANGGAYAVVVTNASGSVTSQAATLTVAVVATNVPVITVQPQSYTTNAGGTVVLSVSVASGQVTTSSISDRRIQAVSLVTYQWYYNGAPLADGAGILGSQSSTLILSGGATRSGSYTCLTTNSVGSTMSQPAILTVSPTADIGRLVNISCRAQVGTGSNVLIAGYVIGGQGTSGSEAILARGAGPALTPYGVAGVLTDPQIDVHQGSDIIATNRGWGGDAGITAAASAVGATTWPDPSSHDAAVVMALGGGVYSVVIAGQSGDTGVALAELYDATPAGTYVPTTPRLINISARTQVGTGANVLIAGFVIGGSTSRTVLIRASGPALIPFGVAGTLPDPQLQLYSGSTVLTSNSGWGGGAQISAAAATVGAFAWTDPASNDSAVLVTLPPGVYSAKVSGAGGDSGVALIEVYEVP